MTLSRVERIMLSNQARILEGLYPDEAAQWQLVQEALNHGYEGYFDIAFQYVYPDSELVTAAKSKEILDILDMFSALQRSADTLPEPAKSALVNKVIFPGFDGNNESSQLAFATFLWRVGRYSDVRYAGDGNSHSQVLDRYRRMLDVWGSSKDKWRLTEPEIQRILAA